MGEDSVSVAPGRPYSLQGGAEVVASVFVSFRITDIVAAVYCGANIPEKVKKAAEDYIQQAFALIPDAGAADRSAINAKAAEVLSWQLKSSGIEITGFELLKIIPSDEFLAALERNYVLIPKQARPVI